MSTRTGLSYPIPDDTRTKGPFKPMRFEATIEDCIVSHGEIPRELSGGFYRVGPTWRRPPKQGFVGIFAMDGMAQGLTFDNGRASFRNRWIRTPKFVTEQELGRPIFEYADGDSGDYRSWGLGQVVRNDENKGVSQGINIVNIFPFAGDVIASSEQGGPPIALDPHTLETKGIVPWAGDLSRGLVEPSTPEDNTFTAHPKWDPQSGRLYGWGYADEPPYVTLHWVDTDGSVSTRELWDAPYECVAHDMWLTENYMVLPFHGLHMTKKRIAEGLSPWGWDPERSIKLALIPRNDMHGEIRWITADIEPQLILHTLSANEVDGKLILDGPIFNRPPFPFEDKFNPGMDPQLFWKLARSAAGRWIVDLKTGNVTSEYVSDRPSELPKVDERYYGRPYEWGFMLAGRHKGEGMHMDTVVQCNVRTGEERAFQVKYDTPVAIYEGTFTPRFAGSAEGDGYYIVPVAKWAENTSEFLIFDTDDISDGPIARIDLPLLIGWTPHGHWMDWK